MTAPAFALLHGGGQGGWVWAETIAVLEIAGAQCLALDVPGCGTKRGIDTSELGIPDIVAELAADIRNSGLNDIILVGHSQAGTVLPLIALAEPSLVRHLVYLCCSAPLPGQSISTMMGTSLHGQHPDEVGWVMDRAVVDKQALYRRMFCSDMDEDQTAAFLTREHRDDWPMASNLATDRQYGGFATLSSTYIVCERDMALPLVWQHRFADRLQVTRRVLLDAGHQAMTTQPEALAALLLADAASR